VETVTSRDGTAIAFDRAGSGPSLVLVGGVFQHRALDPRSAELAALLGEGFSVYHYDRRGRGDSAPYAVEPKIEDLGALIEHAGESAFVFGMSTGAVLAARAGAAPCDREVGKHYEPRFIVDDSRPDPRGPSRPWLLSTD
jgi:pimeloyl-ACP methyl ester carboxylesterase